MPRGSKKLRESGAGTQIYNGARRQPVMRPDPMAPMLSLHARLVRSVLLVAGVCFAATGEARTHGSASDFARAEKQREALETKPLAQRTHAAYERVLNAYRAIYQATPADREADAAVDAVASLLAEEGRSFHDPQLLRASIEQYEFLRRRYPASAFRQSALLSEAEIQQSDLRDDAAARLTFTRFLQMYGSSPMAGEARQQLRALEKRAPQAPASMGTNDDSAEVLTPAERAARNAAEHARELAELNRVQSAASLSRPAAHVHPLPVQESATVLPTAHGEVLITGIRHWSTPVYTRVAIDLSDQVQYEAARVPNPDRIYFDLQGARLAPELAGKSFTITDDGFLRRIRAGAFAGESGSASATRVVLDVSHVSEYSAFFLPNPWRLIIDIHGSAPTSSGKTILQANAVSSTSMDGQATAGTARKPETAGGSQQEVASLAQQPSRVRATRRPTTGPIAASVSGVVRAPQQNELDSLAQDGASSTGAGSEAPALTTKPDEEAGTGTPSAVPAKKVRHGTPAALPGRPSETVSTTVATRITPETPELAAREATPTSTGERSLVRTLGLKIGRIVIDAGHGGHDSGTLGADGLEEKDVVLDVSLRLGKLLKQRLGADVIYTRADDSFIPLETRTAIANKAQADLFVSVHANSSSDASARGVEVYYLNFTTSPEALETAARENAVSNQSIYQLSDLVKKITLKDKIDESHEFAADVQTSLYSGLAPGSETFKDRGVKKAPFVVLIGANMPSILAEISFLTNPEDARQLRDPGYRERIAESLYGGIARYVSGLSGVRLAQGGHHAAGN